MSFGELLLLAVGLAMDAMTAAAALGCRANQISIRQVATIASLFGGFQALMPLLGWWIGTRVGTWAQSWDHWIIFGVLVFLGIKMVIEARRPEETQEGYQPFRIHVLLVLAIATSIDAFAVGITLPLMGVPLVSSLVTIGVTTAFLSTLGLVACRYIGAHLGTKLDIAGGVVLIALGTKTLIEHLST